MIDDNKKEYLPLVSVIIPVYNRKIICKNAILSALNQDYSNIEIIVGDNCSTDGTFQYLSDAFRDYSNVLIFQNRENLGPVGNWKECLKRCKGEYVKILWSDDLMESTFISKSIKIMSDNPDISFVYSKVIMFHNEDELNDSDYCMKTIKKYRFGNTGIRKGSEFIKHSMMRSYAMPVSPGCAIFRKSKIRIVDDIPNYISYDHNKTGAGVDLFIFFNALDNNEKFAFIDEPLNYFREHEGSISCYDDKIFHGYMSAKISFLERNPRYKNLYKYINSDAAALRFGTSIHRKAIVDFLQYFYGSGKVEYSIINELWWGILREFWMIRDYKFRGDKDELFSSWRKRFLGE